MKIKLNDSDLKEIIKLVINESAGVPENIVETSKKMISKIIEHIKNDINKNAETENFFIIKDNFKIGDFSFNSMQIIVEVIRTQKQDSEDYLNFNSASSVVSSKREGEFFVRDIEYSPENNMIVLTFTTTTPYTIKNSNVLKYLIGQENYFIKVITHELKHQYDKIKKPLSPLIKRADYSGFAENMGNSIEPINDFVKALYYTNDFENLVRNSEVYSQLKKDNITKDEFKYYLENTYVYKTLLRYKNINIDTIIGEIKQNYTNELNLIKTPFEISTDEKINLLFKQIYLLIRDTKLNYLKNYLTNIVNGVKILFGKNEEYYNNELKKMNNTDVMSYFRIKQIEINKNAEKTIKKLSKLYSLLEEQTIIREKTTTYYEPLQK